MPTTVDVALSQLAELAYSDTPTGVPAGFSTLGAGTLGIALDAGMSFANGVFHNANAAALVVAGLINGAPALVLTFRGSDDREDSINSLRNINADYSDFAPLIAAVDAYAARAGFQEVVVAGHSLGGAMTQLYMANHPNTAAIRYIADDFGSPGALISDGPDPRTINFRIADDSAVFLGENRASVGAELRFNPVLAGVGAILATDAFPGLTTLDAIGSLPYLTQDYENRGQDYVLPRANGTTFLLQDLGDAIVASPAEHDVGTYVARLAAQSGGPGDIRFLSSQAEDGFDPLFYVRTNPDVAVSGMNPLVHFQQYGWHEGRNPDAYFDTGFYLSQNPDVAAAGMEPLAHYDAFGWHEGRNPSTHFSTGAYLAAYPDVAAAGVNPLQHYLQYGVNEGRSAFGDLA